MMLLMRVIHSEDEDEIQEEIRAEMEEIFKGIADCLV